MEHSRVGGDFTSNGLLLYYGRDSILINKSALGMYGGIWESRIVYVINYPPKYVPPQPGVGSVPPGVEIDPLAIVARLPGCLLL